MYTTQTDKTNVGKHEWYYIDKEKKEQGPFTSEDMEIWYKQGFLPQDLQIRCGNTEKKYLSIEEQINKYPDTLFIGYITKLYQKDKSDKIYLKYNNENENEIENENENEYRKWFYMAPYDTKIYGPYSTKQMKYWVGKGYFSYQNIRIRMEGERYFIPFDSHPKSNIQISPFGITTNITPYIEKYLQAINTNTLETFMKTVVQEYQRKQIHTQHAINSSINAINKINDNLNTSTTKVTVPPTDIKNTSTASRWYYQDHQGKEQGPFTTLQMRNWYTRGLLPSTIRVKEILSDNTSDNIFIPISARNPCPFL